MLVLGSGELAQQVAHGIVMRGFRRAPVKARGLVFHLLGEFARGIDRQRAVEPDRPARDKAFDVLAADQRQKIAEFLAMKFEQHVAMPDLFLRHLVVHFRSVGIRAAERIREGAVNAVVLVFIGDRERKDLLLV